MSYQWAIAIALHQLGTVVWVGGMFFAHMVLRPSANELLDPPRRLPLLLRVFEGFFPWVWLAIVLLWASGSWIFLGVYGARAGMHVHAMMGIATLMTGLFAFLRFVPFRHMKAAVAAADWPAAAGRLAAIRAIMLANLILGIMATVLGSVGPKLI